MPLCQFSHLIYPVSNNTSTSVNQPVFRCSYSWPRYQVSPLAFSWPGRTRLQVTDLRSAVTKDAEEKKALRVTVDKLRNEQVRYLACSLNALCEMLS
jgi:hypothetical protein